MYKVKRFKLSNTADNSFLNDDSDMDIEVPVIPRRAKAYELQKDSWFDRGTGFCVGELSQGCASIIVKSEEYPDKLLLETRICKDVQYQKQEDTLIVWTDPDYTDLALSFQEPEGCLSIWDFINDVQQRMGGPNDYSSEYTNEILNAIKNLPVKLSLSNINEVESIFATGSTTQFGRDSIIRTIHELNYFDYFPELFSKAENIKSIDSLYCLCRIVKNLLLLNDNWILEQILTDACFLSFVGILEYDPDFSLMKPDYRNFLSNESQFKEVVPIPDDGIKLKIKQTFRLQYFKDVVLARLLDDSKFSMLSSMIYFNQVEILQYLQNSESFIDDLFALYGNSNSDITKKRDGINFLHQFATISKNLPLEKRTTLYVTFIQKGLLNAIEFALKDSDTMIRTAGTECIVIIIEVDSSLLRTLISKESCADDVKSLIKTLVKFLLAEKEMGVKLQMFEAIKVLLDYQTSTSNDYDNDNNLKYSNDSFDAEDLFLSFFYDNAGRDLFNPIIKYTNEFFPDLEMVSVLIYLCDLICYCIRQHGRKSREFYINSGIWGKLVLLLYSSSKQLKLAALRCFRQCLNTDDEYTFIHLIKNKYIGDILDVFLVFDEHNNLINSAFLDFFEFIRRNSSEDSNYKNIDLILNHLVDCYADKLKLIQCSNIGESLIAKKRHLQGDSISLDSDYTISIKDSNENNLEMGYHGRSINLSSIGQNNFRPYDTNSRDDLQAIKDELLRSSMHNSGTIKMISEIGSNSIINNSADCGIKDENIKDLRKYNSSYFEDIQSNEDLNDLRMINEHEEDMILGNRDENVNILGINDSFENESISISSNDKRLRENQEEGNDGLNINMTKRKKSLDKVENYSPKRNFVLSAASSMKKIALNFTKDTAQKK